LSSARDTARAPSQAAAAPQDAKAIYDQWTIAIHRKDRDRARALAALARAAGMPEATRMSQATDELNPGGWLGLRHWKKGILVSLLLVGTALTLTRPRPRTSNG
jgi:hypothetical protein